MKSTYPIINKHDVDCECPECTGEASYERTEQRYIMAWNNQNIQW